MVFAISKKKTTKAMKNIREWLQEEPTTVATLPKGGNFIPIEALENELDNFDNWGTQNFHYHFYRDGYASLCIAASIEVVIEYKEGDSPVPLRRTFVGACNFELTSIYPIKHAVATAKSECVKNACSDIGKKFGRGINPHTTPNPESTEKHNEGITLVTGIDNVKEEHYVK
jgi:hypothetical protein